MVKEIIGYWGFDPVECRNEFEMFHRNLRVDQLVICEEQAERALQLYKGEYFNAEVNVPKFKNAKVENEMNKAIEEKAEETSVLKAIQEAISKIGPRPLAELQQYSAHDLKMMFECEAAKRVEEQKEKLRVENEMRHLNHPFYERADDYREEERRNQILKGAAKYPEPFNPDNFTPKQLIQHAMQENIDQAHYMYGLYEKIEVMQSYVEHLQSERQKHIRDIGELTKFLITEFPEAGSSTQPSIDVAIELLKDYKIDHDEYFGQRKAHAEMMTDLNSLSKYMVVHYPHWCREGVKATDTAKRVMDAYRKGEEFNAKKF